MNLQYFPFDNQRCTISLESYSFPWSKVKYSWRPGGFRLQQSDEHQQLILPEITLVDYRLQYFSSPQLFCTFSLQSKNVTENDEVKSQLDLVLYFGE